MQRPGSDSGASDSHAGDLHAGNVSHGNGRINSLDVFGIPPSQSHSETDHSHNGITKDGHSKYSTNYDVSNRRPLMRNATGTMQTGLASFGAELSNVFSGDESKDATEVFIGYDKNQIAAQHGLPTPSTNFGDGAMRNTHRQDLAAVALATKEMSQNPLTNAVKNYVAAQMATGDLTGMTKRNGKPNNQHWHDEIENFKTQV